MPEIDPVTLRLFVENGQAVAALSKYGRVADQQFSLVERGARGAENALGALKGVLAGVSAVALARSFLEIADASKSMEAQLRLATASFGTFGQAQEDVRKVAANTRSGLEDISTLYGSFARTAQELGRSQADAAQGTETFSKALKIGGAGTAQVQSATLQLGQALASTNVQWEELGQILEASPRVAKVFTDALGVTRQQLKQMAEDGKLSGKQLFDALNNPDIVKQINAEFAKMPVTFDQAMTQIRNAAITTFGAFDRGGQFSTALANFVMDGAKDFDELADRAAQSGVEIRSAYEGLSDAFEPMLQGALAAFERINGGALGLRDSIASLLGSIDTVRNFLPDLGNKAKAFDNKYLGTNYQMQSRSDLRGVFVKGYDEAQLKGSRAAGLTPASRILKRLSDNTPGKPSAATPVAATSSSGGKKKTGGANSAEAAARKAENDRLKGIRDQANSAREAARLDDDILAARAALATAAEDVLRYQLDAIESERKQQVDDIETQVKLGQLGREEADRRILVNSELASLRGELVKRRAAEAIATREAARSADAADTLRAEADLLTSRQERRDVELRILDYAYKEEEAAIRRAAAAGEIADLDEALANMRRRRAAETEGVNRQNEGPLARYRRDLDNPDRRNDQVESAVIDELEGVRDSISSAVQKTLGIKNPILAALLDSFIEQQLIKPLLDSVAKAAGGEGGGGLIGSIVSGIGSLFGGARAAGGPVQAGKTYLVGEKGQELFRPSTSGTIVPNHQLVGAAARGMTSASAVRPMQSTTIVHAPQFNLRGAVITKELYADMERISEESATRRASMAYSQSMRDAPGAVRRAQRFRTT